MPIDDGVTGTTFNRPGLNAMIDDVRVGKIRTVIIKDQSRIGRDVLEVGLLKRAFEEHGVRFIAANDGMDSANGFDIMSVFRDVINEYYVADASKKIRAVKRSNALAGKSGNRPPYGYRSAGLLWEIDDNAAQYVREIFNRVIAGDGTYVIAKDLSARGIYAPLAHFKKEKGEEINVRTSWSAHTVAQICGNRAYIGHLVAQKVTSASYKNKKRIERSQDEWVITQNHHPPIVDMETFDLVQKYRANRRRFTRVGDISILSGLLWCADCKNKLSLHSSRCSKYQYFTCRTYNNGLNKYAKTCTRHSIRRDIIEELVHEQLHEIIAFGCNNAEFATQMQARFQQKSVDDAKAKTKELARTESRKVELNKIIKQLYEDNIRGKLCDDLFAKFQEDYGREHSELAEKTRILASELKALQSNPACNRNFAELIDAQMAELTADIARRFIDKIVVHEKNITQNIEIFLNCKQFIPN